MKVFLNWLAQYAAATGEKHAVAFQTSRGGITVIIWIAPWVQATLQETGLAPEPGAVMPSAPVPVEQKRGFIYGMWQTRRGAAPVQIEAPWVETYEEARAMAEVAAFQLVADTLYDWLKDDEHKQRP